jgi:hypothetical protein
MKQEKRLTHRKKILIGSVAAVLVLVSAVYVHGIRRVDPQALDKLIGQELPPGSSETKVIAFLDSKGISHSEYVPEYRRIEAQVGRSRVGLVGGRIIIKFYFDSGRRLMSHTLDEFLDFL